MTTVREIYSYLNEKVPFAYQESWDNSGLLAGDPKGEVKKLLLALDITDEVIWEAEELGAQLIVSHHPLIFTPIKRVTLEPEDLTGRKLWRLARGNIAAICCHTNLDAVEGGVNTVLARSLGLERLQQLEPMGTDRWGSPYGIGRVGRLSKPVSLETFLKRVEERLAPNGIRYVSGGRPVSKVAVGGGSCGSMLELVRKSGADTFVTADLKYNQFLDAREYGINLIDAGHFPTENLVLPVLEKWLREGFPKVEVCRSQSHREVISYC